MKKRIVIPIAAVLLLTAIAVGVIFSLDSGGYELNILSDNILAKIEVTGQNIRVLVPDGVEIIGKNSFKDCTELKKITLPDGLEEIGNNAFEGCTKLTEIRIPDSVKIIEVGAFKNCASLKK